MWEFNILVNLLKDFGVNITGFGIIIFLVWKIATNHLAHIAHDIKDIAKDVKAVATKVDEIQEKTALDRERIAKLEGKLE